MVRTEIQQKPRVICLLHVLSTHALPYIAQAQLPRKGTSHSGLGLLHWSATRKTHTDMPTGQSDGGNPQLRFPFPDDLACVKLKIKIKQYTGRSVLIQEHLLRQSLCGGTWGSKCVHYSAIKRAGVGNRNAWLCTGMHVEWCRVGNTLCNTFRLFPIMRLYCLFS